MGGHFITQQVGGGFTDDFHRALGLPPISDPRPRWELNFATRQLKAAGLRVIESGEGFETQTYSDAAALAWYLLAVPWTVEGFSIPRYREQLHRLHQHMREEHPLTVQLPMFWLTATPE